MKVVGFGRVQNGAQQPKNCPPMPHSLQPCREVLASLCSGKRLIALPSTFPPKTKVIPQHLSPPHRDKGRRPRPALDSARGSSLGTPCCWEFGGPLRRSVTPPPLKSAHRTPSRGKADFIPTCPFLAGVCIYCSS